MFGLWLLIESKLNDISREFSRQNDLKEQEIRQQAEQNERKECLDSLRRMNDSSLIELFRNTPETITYTNILVGGIGSKVLFESGEISEPNEKYIDIKNECLIRNLIKL